jgi:hypothetical protein
MNSVGFKTAQDKIVLTAQTGSNWGYGSSNGTATVCFMDTSLSRSASEQPWCDGTSQSTSNLLTETGHGGCGGACTFTNYKEASFTGGSVASGFYTAVLDWTDDYGLEYDWKPAPGWLANQQGNSKFHHFHWPAFAINSDQLGSGWCTVRAKGTAPQDNKNPGGVLTMCGADLQAWLDNVLPKPDVSVGVGMAKNDSNLLGADRNRNDGFNPALSLIGKRGVGFNSVVVEFDQAQVLSFLDEGTLSRATLVLTVKQNRGRWGRHGQWVVAYPLLDLFMEGNGNAAAGDRGAGMGVTWNCALDLDIANDEKECLFEWTGLPRFRPRWNGPSAAVRHFDHTTGAVEWDVTEDVASGITAWILQKAKRWRGGGVDYYSRQGARAVNDTNLAPTLMLER